jgi:excisionase family DNA binding protein
MPESCKSSAPEETWLTMSQAMQYLQVSRRTLYRLMDEGMLPYYRITGTRQRRFKRSDLDQLMVLEEPGAIDESDESDDDSE